MKLPEVLQAVDPDGHAGRIFDELEADAIRRHTRTKSLVKHFDAGDRRMEFNVEDAAREAIAHSRIPPIDIWEALTRITSVGPATVMDTVGFPGETWEEFTLEVSCVILWREIYLRHPEVLEDDNKREDYWAARTLRKWNPNPGMST